ncbi:MAG TPA: LmeA family phospholipid-binding protein [Methylomirabilota bacterium]
MRADGRLGWGPGRLSRTQHARGGWALVAAAFLVVAAVAGIWLALDRRPPEWDHANHLERAVLCGRDLTRGDVTAALDRSSFYPPLVPCAAGLAYRLLPTDVVTAQIVVLAFLALGMIAIHVLARDVGGRFAGVMAASVFAFAPFVVYSALRFQLDLPLAALVVVAVLALLRADGFQRFGWSVAAGVVLGLGMLTKPPFVVYVMTPLAVLLIRVRSGAAALNAALALVLAAAMSIPWYGPRLMALPLQIANRSFKQAAESGHPPPFTWAALTIYPREFVTQFGVVAVLLFAVGLVVMLGRRRWLLVASLLVPFLVFELIQNKNPRYTLPLLPLAAVFAGVAAGAAPRWLRTPLAAVVLLAGALQISVTAFGFPRDASVPGLGVPVAEAAPPLREQWPVRDVLAAIARDGGRAGATVSVIPNHIFFSVSNFRYYALRDGLPLRFLRAWEGEPLGIDYMVLKSGDVGPSWTAEKPRRVEARFTSDPYLARVYPVIGEFRLPDGSLATLRVRRVPADLEAAPDDVARALENAVTAALPAVARDVEALRVGLDYDSAILRGVVRRVDITAGAATVAEFARPDAARLRLHDLRLVLTDVIVDPLRALKAGGLQPLDVGRLRIDRATVTAADFQAFLAGLRKFRPSLSLEPGALAFALHQPGPDVTGRVRLSAARAPFAVTAEDVRLGAIALPPLLVNWVMRGLDPSARIASRLPIPVELGRIVVTPSAIQVGD